MADVHITPDEIQALHAARVALVTVRDWSSACEIDELLTRARAARMDEIGAAVVAELTDRRGRLKVVGE